MSREPPPASSSTRKMLEGLRSRWMMPSLCAVFSASAMGRVAARMSWALIRLSKSSSSSRRSERVSPCRSSMAM
jgi:hypothetical protein